MTGANRAPSGARLLGDDVQHLIVWYHVLLALRSDSGVEHLQVEASGAGNVDDLTLTYGDRSAEYWQIKASVDSSRTLDEAWLFQEDRKSGSLLQRLFKSWSDLSNQGDWQRSTAGPVTPTIVLATTRAILPSDPVLGRRATSDARVVEVLKAESSTGDRARWAQHLGTTEDELIKFLTDLYIRHGQSEVEWRQKVVDAAASVGVRADAAGIALGIQQVRGWVKAPRQEFDAEQLALVVRQLGLKTAPTRDLVVLQALERNPRAADARHVTDWVDLFDGTDARSRRTLVNPDDSATILSDIAKVRHALRADGARDVELDGPMRLPLWFTVGTQLGQTAGFSLAAANRDPTTRESVLWSSTSQPRTAGARLERFSAVDAATAPTVGTPLAISINVSVDIREDVEEYRKVALPHAEHFAVFLPECGSSAMPDASVAVGFAIEVRDLLRSLTRSCRAAELHLFLAMPGAAALILGSYWDRLPPTTTYWDAGSNGYAPAFRIEN